jgi:hypothetical protein
MLKIFKRSRKDLVEDKLKELETLCEELKNFLEVVEPVCRVEKEIHTLAVDKIKHEIMNHKNPNYKTSNFFLWKDSGGLKKMADWADSRFDLQQQAKELLRRAKLTATKEAKEKFSGVKYTDIFGRFFQNGKRVKNV